MVNPSLSLALEPASVEIVHRRIKDYIHHTPVLVSSTIDDMASSSEDEEVSPRFRIFFKCENHQRVGAFKIRGAFNAILGLIESLGVDELQRRGVTTHSSGNHAQALSCAAATFDIPAYIVMPKIAPACKIAGTRRFTTQILFSGHTSQERQSLMQQIIDKTGAIYVPSTDHPDIMLGQGTAALEFQEQYESLHRDGTLDAVLIPLGGGGLLSGTVLYFSDKPQTFVIGCEPSFQGANDGENGFKSVPPRRVETVETLTIADGLRIPVAKRPWDVFTSGSSIKARYLENIYSVTEHQIKDAFRLILINLRVLIEPSSAVPLAVILFNSEFRRWAWERQRAREVDHWDIGIILSGGNCDIETLRNILESPSDAKEVV